MSCQEGDFHFVDLLALHICSNISVPEGRGLLPLLHRVTDVHLPALFLYPPQLVAVARDHLHSQYPWLEHLVRPAVRDWVTFWAWVDKTQQRIGTPEDKIGTAYPVTTMAREMLPPLPQIIIIQADDGDA
jgi:hypothetical protein